MIYTAGQIDLKTEIINAGLVKRRAGTRKKKKERELVGMVCAFDIETSTIYRPDENGEDKPHSFMYIWQFQFGPTITIYGRTWDEFKDLLKNIKDGCIALGAERNLSENPLLCVYVHNLAYEFQFLSGIFSFSQEDVFCRAARKPIYARLENTIEFRCSYIQSNMSLAKFAEKMGCNVQKLSGQEFDYSKIRYPWTELTDKEKEYCFADVQCLVEAIQNEMIKDGDNLHTIPLTSTGYVRRDCKKAVSDVRLTIMKMLPDMEQYKLLRRAFRGGNTHANRYYTGKIIENVESVDMTSCYPAQQLTKLFPMSPFRWLEPDSELMPRLKKFIKMGRAVVGDYAFKNIKLKDENIPVPYISYGKCEAVNAELDNGRILSAEYIRIALTEIDLAIIEKQYKFEGVHVYSAMIATKKPLPDEYREVIQGYYNKKTELKGVEGEDNEYLYMKSKNKLNSIYGMSAQQALHNDILFNGTEYIESAIPDNEADEKLKKANFPYQWGVYTTAYARAALQDGIDLAGEKMVYCDTDSVKTEGHIDFTALNEKRLKAAKSGGAYAADKNGGVHYMGVFEVDGKYTRFITQGAKRYAFEKDKHGKLEMGVTVSGVTHKVNEETGIPFAVEELKGLENFKPGMIWRKAGGTDAVYNDEDDFDYKTSDGVIHISRNVSIVNSTYELEYSSDYATLLDKLRSYMYWKEKNNE